MFLTPIFLTVRGWQHQRCDPSQPRASLVPRFALGWLVTGLWPSNAAFGMKRRVRFFTARRRKGGVLFSPHSGEELADEVEDPEEEAEDHQRHTAKQGVEKKPVAARGGSGGAGGFAEEFVVARI